MNKIHTVLCAFVLIAVFLISAKPAFAKLGGCVDSPEDPTIVMAAIGIGAAGTPWVWSKFRAFKRRR